MTADVAVPYARPVGLESGDLKSVGTVGVYWDKGLVFLSMIQLKAIMK